MKTCPQCNLSRSSLLKSKGICANCNSNNWYKDHRCEVLQRTRKYGREKTRKKKGLPLDHPRLIGEIGAGHLSESTGYRYVTKIGHPNATPYKKGINKKGHVTYHGGRLEEHRFVMSEHLGRPLTKNESVHHKNGIKHDNSIENLELWHRGQPMGQRIEDKIEWAKEFLKEYGYEIKKR